MSLLLVSGLSGAGKSTVVNILEDIGYFCVDNIPSGLISKFIEFYDSGESSYRNVALVADIRGNDSKEDIQTVLDAVKKAAQGCKILFLDAKSDVIERRYRESRRRHPISIKLNVSTAEAIKMERAVLAPVYGRADYIMDTSFYNKAQLRERVLSLFEEKSVSSMAVNVMSFGFKFGLPKDADLVFDVRCLPNPYYIPELKDKTGLDFDVEEYIFNFEESKKLLEIQKQLLEYSLPLYKKEGKSQLTIALGCTGGKHRSIAFAQRIYEFCKKLGYAPQVIHRDIQRFN